MESGLGSAELLLVSVTGPQLSVVTGTHPDLGCDAEKGRCIFLFPHCHGRKMIPSASRLVRGGICPV